LELAALDKKFRNRVFFTDNYYIQGINKKGKLVFDDEKPHAVNIKQIQMDNYDLWINNGA